MGVGHHLPCFLGLLVKTRVFALAGKVFLASLVSRIASQTLLGLLDVTEDDMRVAWRDRIVLR
ncbi:hypothetical protein HOV93_22510 [Planctomycetes bacterium FF15]|uniref:Uncharacterized protein n=1 Tax=Bremerella alba TaxID=980252 RepID=A0A7V8V511_9BACT|nr:hypothetical protein [Bremerella alba]